MYTNFSMKENKYLGIVERKRTELKLYSIESVAREKFNQKLYASRTSNGDGRDDQQCT